MDSNCYSNTMDTLGPVPCKEVREIGFRFVLCREVINMYPPLWSVLLLEVSLGIYESARSLKVFVQGFFLGSCNNNIRMH